MRILDRADKIQGWMSGPELEFLADTAFISSNILEVGSYRGRSTRALVDNTQGIVHAVDPWDGKYQIYGNKDYPDDAYISYHENGDNTIYSEFCINLHDHIKTGKVRVHRLPFLEFQTKETFDFIFIDAIHEYEALKKDINHALKFMNSGILAGHDYCGGWPGVMKLVDELFPNCPKAETIWFTQI